MGEDRKDAQIERTRKLLTRWRDLRWHSVNALTDYRQVQDTDIAFLVNNPFADPDMYLKSVTRSKQITQMLLSHTEKAIAGWLAANGRTHAGRLRRRIIRKRYLDTPGKTFSEISKEEGVPRYTVVSQHDIAVRELAGRIFGTDNPEITLGAVRA